MVDRRGSNQFTRRLKLNADKFERGAQKMIQNAAKAALEVVVLGSRVDTATSRSNWIVTRDAPNSGTISAYSPYPKGSKGGGEGSAETANAATALANGFAIIEEYQLGVDPDLFITNNVRYLRYIPEMGALTTEAADAARLVLRAVKLL
jgi:hypothetical protein